MARNAKYAELTSTERYLMAFGGAVEAQNRFLGTPAGKLWLGEFSERCDAAHENARQREKIRLGIRPYEEPYCGN